MVIAFLELFGSRVTEEREVNVLRSCSVSNFGGSTVGDVSDIFMALPPSKPAAMCLSFRNCLRRRFSFSRGDSKVCVTITSVD